MNTASWALTVSIVSGVMALLALILNYRNTRINAKRYKDETHGKKKADFSIKRDGDNIHVKNQGSDALIMDIIIDGVSISENGNAFGDKPDTIAKGSEYSFRILRNLSSVPPNNIVVIYSDAYYREVKNQEGEPPSYETTV